MMNANPIVLIVARYEFKEDAKADLESAARCFVDKAVNVYDAALLMSDAWGQVQIQDWEVRLPAGVPSVIRRARADLVGQPLAARHDPGFDLRAAAGSLSWRDLEGVGLAMGPVSSVLVVAAQTGESEAFASCFARASRIARRQVEAEPTGKYPALGPTLQDMLTAG
jgi:hypothetical protein